MKSVLIVHDRPTVAAAIRDVVISCGVDAAGIEVATDYYSARAMLGQHIFDLVIIDLTIPLSNDGGSASFQPVEQLLNELFKMDTLNPPGDIIGITREIDTLDLVDTSLGPHLMVSIPEDASGKWKSYLSDKVKYALRAAQTRYVSVNRHYAYDALIVTAMDREMEPYNDEFEFVDVKYFEGAKEFLFKDAAGAIRRGIAYSIGRSGQASAASHTQALVTCFRPRVTYMSGYCGGVKGKVELGDLVFFETTYAWDYGKWIEEGSPPSSIFRCRPNPISVDGEPAHKIARQYVTSDFNRAPAMLTRIQELSLGRLDRFEVHLCPAASGSAVVANDDIVSRIRGLDDSIRAVDMEAYGFYHASKFTRVVRPHFMCVKAVSDFCNGEKEDGLHRVCSHISASVVIDALRSKWVFD